MSEHHEPDEQAFAERFGRAYLRTPLPAAEARARIVAAARAAGRPRQAGAGLSAWLEPRRFTIRPIAAVAAALALVAAGALISQWLPRGPAGRSAGTSPVVIHPVRFVCAAGSASRVALVGDFNGWDAAATPMRHEPGTGTWTVTVSLPAGWHAYAFLVDGKHWIPDPQAPLAPSDDFGEPRSVVVVGESGA
jgi:hypothetical protein